MAYKLKENKPEIYWTADCERIQRVMKEAYDLDITLHTAQWIWEDYSESYCASWLYLPTPDEELIGILRLYVEEE